VEINNGIFFLKRRRENEIKSNASERGATFLKKKLGIMQRILKAMCH
jgi:hypothetical protein